MTGWTVPGYTGIRALGAGGTGRVVEAVHIESGARVAIKYLSPGLWSDAAFRERLRTEAVALAGLEHPNVVRLREVVETGSGAAVVMDFVEGVSLREVLAVAAPLSPEAALAVLRQSLLGLGVVQYLGIVHRDYQPANVILTAEGECKLVGFGIAERSGAMVPAAGTPSYMAPELWEGAPASSTTDVYAATVTLYECLTGRVPYVGDSVFELQTMHRAAPIPISDVPPGVRQLLAQGLAKTAEARPAMVAFLGKLEEAATVEYGPGWEERGQQELARLTAPLIQPLIRDANTNTNANTNTYAFDTREISAPVDPIGLRTRAAHPADTHWERAEDRFDSEPSWASADHERPGMGRGAKAGIALTAVAVVGVAMAAMTLGSGKSTPAASAPSGGIVSATSDSGSSQDGTAAGAGPGAPSGPGTKTTGTTGQGSSATSFPPGMTKPPTAPASSVASVATGTQIGIGMSLPSQSSDGPPTLSWPSSQGAATTPIAPTTSTAPTSSAPSQTPSSTVTVSAAAQAVNATYTGTCPPTAGPTVKVTFTVAGLPSGGTVAVTYHWHVTDGSTGDGADQTATVGNGDTSFQLTVNPQQTKQQPAADSVTIDWTTATGLSGTTNKVPITVNCQ